MGKPKRKRRARNRNRLRLVDSQPAEQATAVIADARSVAEDAAAVAQSAAAALLEAESEGEGAPEALHDAVAAVQEAAVVVQEAAELVAGAARTWPDVDRRVRPRVPADDPRVWPDVDRRRNLRLPAFARHEAHVDWRHLAFYAPILLLVIAVGGFALWAFFERQTLAVRPLPLPKVTLLTGDPNAPLTASWVKLLAAAEMQPTLVPVDKVESFEGVVALCNLWHVSPALNAELAAYIRRGGGVVILGAPPAEAIGPVQLAATGGESDDGMKLSEAASPILARINPGVEMWTRPSHVAFLTETPRMSVDARWRGNARAVVMHMEQRGTRVLWLGFDPTALTPEPDRQLLLLVRTGFRWAAQQPISEGAVGAANEAKTFTPDARRDAHAAHFAFSVDPLLVRGSFVVRLQNHGNRAIDNPTVKVWLPSGMTNPYLGGDFLMRGNASVVEDAEDEALVSVPRLAPNEERVVKLKAERR